MLNQEKIETSAPVNTRKNKKKMSKKDRFRQMFMIVSGLAFVIGSVGGVWKNLTYQPPEQTQQTASIEQQIASQKKGYELVLQREPNNEIALRGLVDLSIQTNNLAAAIAPLEKLVALHPKEEAYQKLLEEVKFRANQSTSEKPTTSPEKK